jgi:hypothetical protein
MQPFCTRLAAATLLLLAVGCSGDNRNGGSRSEARAAFAVVQAAHSDLITARAVLGRCEAAGSPGGTDTGALQQARSAYDAAYQREQKVLAAFLTVALNERPSEAETREALGFYADAAVDNARIILERSGDAHRALETLETAAHPFRTLGIPLPTDLAATIEEARRVQSSPPTATPTPSPHPPAQSRRRPSRGGRARR